MPHERFFCRGDLESGTHAVLTESEHHHLTRVMRIRVGEEVDLVNGQGTLAKAKILEILKETSVLKVLSSKKIPLLTPLLFLAIPLMRPAKLEWIVEKGTEIGADTFLIYCADSSEKEALSKHQIERLHILSIAALKQSGRLYLPPLEFLPHLETVFERKATFFFGNPTSPSLFSPEPVNTVFITGPEKGFSERELVLLKEKAKEVFLSPYILRAETAPLVAASLFTPLKGKAETCSC